MSLIQLTIYQDIDIYMHKETQFTTVGLWQNVTIHATSGRLMRQYNVHWQTSYHVPWTLSDHTQCQFICVTRDVIQSNTDHPRTADTDVLWSYDTDRCDSIHYYAGTTLPHISWHAMTRNSFLLLWPWPWPYDVNIRTWPRYYEEVPAYEKWTF